MKTMKLTPQQMENVSFQAKLGLADKNVFYDPFTETLTYDDATASRIEAADKNKVVTKAPDKVDLWQARAALKDAGLFTAIDAFVESQHQVNPALWEAWNMGNVVTRGGVFVTALAPQLNLSETQIDDLLRAAAAIKG